MECNLDELMNIIHHVWTQAILEYLPVYPELPR